jgi:circadian clock protein KaiC
MEFLVRGITLFNEPRVFVAFEETADDLIANVASLGFDLARYEADRKFLIEHINVANSEVEVTGDWDLEGLLLRLGAAIDQVGAKRVVIDRVRCTAPTSTRS